MEALEYYEFHYLVKDLLEFMKKENEANQGGQDQQSANPSGMKIPDMKMPNMKMPKL